MSNHTILCDIYKPKESQQLIFQVTVFKHPPLDCQTVFLVNNSLNKNFQLLTMAIFMSLMDLVKYKVSFFHHTEIYLNKLNDFVIICLFSGYYSAELSSSTYKEVLQQVLVPCRPIPLKLGNKKQNIFDCSGVLAM